MGDLDFLIKSIAISSFMGGVQVLWRWTAVQNSNIYGNARHQNSHTELDHLF